MVVTHGLPEFFLCGRTSEIGGSPGRCGARFRCYLGHRNRRGSIRWRLGTAVAALVEAGLGNSPLHKIYLGEAGVVAILLAYLLLLLLLRAPVARLTARRKGRP
jgi:hypothetical protein